MNTSVGTVAAHMLRCSRRLYSTPAAPRKHIGRVIMWNPQYGHGLLSSLSDGSCVSINRKDLFIENRPDANIRVGSEVEWTQSSSSRRALNVQAVGGGALPVVADWEDHRPRQATLHKQLQLEKRTPSRDVPWVQLQNPTFLTSLEMHYGRKEMWHTIADLGVKLRLLVMLSQYIADCRGQVKATAHQTQRAYKQCAEYRRRHVQWVVATMKDPSILQRWQQWWMFPGDVKGGRQPTTTHRPAEIADNLGSSSNLLSESQTRRRALREAGDYHALPFLRDRVRSNPSTLDGKLVDLAKRSFPEDHDGSQGVKDGVGPVGSSAVPNQPTSTEMKRAPSAALGGFHVNAKQKMRAIFRYRDARGKMLGPNNRPVRASLNPSTGSGRGGRILQETSEQSTVRDGYEAKRARERRLRISRGQLPSEY